MKLKKCLTNVCLFSITGVGMSLSGTEDTTPGKVYDCPICKDKLKNPPQIHYGGAACFSCRAFFRRAHQKTKAPNFKCKNDNKCLVTIKTRRKCQKCRYNLCLEQGMKPEAVLTDDQKKIRFRNSIQKKARSK